MTIAQARWTRERIIAYKKYLQGDKSVEFRGAKHGGEPYKSAVPVGKLIERSKHKFKVSGSKLLVEVGDKWLEIISEDALEKLVQRLYKNKAIALGKAPQCGAVEGLLHHIRTKSIRRQIRYGKAYAVNGNGITQCGPRNGTRGTNAQAKRVCVRLHCVHGAQLLY